jgi:ABC-type nitrate/sulfonate/bicarbonate transport system substrate-binding protein
MNGLGYYSSPVGDLEIRSEGDAITLVGFLREDDGNENCVVATQPEIDKDSAAELEGKRVAVPMGTGAQYTFLQLMEHLKVDATTMSIVDMAPLMVRRRCRKVMWTWLAAGAGHWPGCRNTAMCC